MPDREVVHHGPIPVFVQIAGFLREMITSGELVKDQRVPTELDIVQAYGVSRSSARRAVAALRDEGLVYTVPQRGTFVR